MMHEAAPGCTSSLENVRLVMLDFLAAGLKSTAGELKNVPKTKELSGGAGVRGGGSGGGFAPHLLPQQRCKSLWKSPT